MRDEKLMRAALAVAAEGLDSGELPIGAVVALDGAVIARAHTAERASGRLLVHADLLALQAVDELRPSAAERRRMVFAVNLEPCLMCLGAVMSALFGDYVARFPDRGGFTAWARTLASGQIRPAR